jgi:hypothetical protein
MIAIRGHEYLRLVAQTAKTDRMDNAIAIALEIISRTTRGAVRFDV